MTSFPDWPETVGLRRHDILDSTNQEALRLACAGERGPLWIVAAQQRAGRGRHGREWVSVTGNLFATLLIEAAPLQSAQIGFVAGISAADVIARYVPCETIKLKWPNDILIAGKKAAGILVEHVGPDVVAAGIGINLAHCPQGAFSLAGFSGIAPHPDDVLCQLAVQMHQWIAVWREDGFAPIRNAWIARAGGIGESIRAVTARISLDGTFESLDSDGALLLRDRQGVSHRITAADVFYGG